jgi:hypothetical protein
VPANRVYSVAFEMRARSRRDRTLRWAARFLGALMVEGADPGEPDASSVVYRVVVRDRASGRAIKVEEYPGDEAAAQEAYRRLARQLASMEPDEFRGEYRLSDDGPTG